MDEPIPEALRQFLLEHVESVVQVEALLLMRRQKGRAWTALEVARLLYVNEGRAEDLLARLHTHGLLARESDIYTYSPATPSLAAMIDLLAETYARALIPVTNFIHDNSAGLRLFADAFRLRK